jgi:O-antigen ligase
MTRGEVDPFEGDPLLRTILVLVYLVSIGVLLLYPRKTLTLIARYPLPWILVGWTLLSVLWSAAPEITLRRGIAAMLASLYAVVLVLRFDFKDLLRILGIALAIALLSSLLLVWAVPSWGVMQGIHEGFWQGVFTHKNTLGMVSVFALLVFGTLWLGHKGMRRWMWGGLGVVALILLLGSRSASGLVLGSGIIAGGLALFLMRKIKGLLRPAFLMGLFVTVMVLIALLVANYEFVLKALGKTPTLSGRLPLWSALWPMAMDRFWLGYGFEAFWLGRSGPSAEVWRVALWQPSHGHNGYLDLWLSLGMIGLVLGVMMLLCMICLSARKILFERRASLESSFWFLFGVFLTIYNFSESLFLQPEMLKAIYWILFVYGYMRVAATYRLDTKGQSHE